MTTISTVLFLALCLSQEVVAWPIDPIPSPSLPGTFVPFSQLSQCPKLKSKGRPSSAHDVRPDDFSVVIAFGDSITAGLLARGGRDEVQSPFSTRNGQSSFSLTIAEYRGVSYPIGGDEGAITIPNILSHYSNLTGSSTGHHVPLSCLNMGVVKLPSTKSSSEDRNHMASREGRIVENDSQGDRWSLWPRPWRWTQRQKVGGMCLPHPESDGLNAAISGSTSGMLLSQVRDYVVPTIQKLGIKDEEWKYVNLGIGANDVCAFCLTPNMTSVTGSERSFTGSPQEFAQNIKVAVEELRATVPNIIVNIIGLLRVSDIYKLTLKDPYCQPPLFPLPVPHLALECSCALLPGPAGDYTRAKMDELGEAYDSAVLEIIKEWEEEDDPSFGVIWQPGTVVDLAQYPMTALSPIDCFHPSESAHQRVAAGFWNRLTLDWGRKSIPIPWEEDPLIRCLEDDDRIPVGMISAWKEGRG